jgi:Cft2 family RNA processing exonuclease
MMNMQQMLGESGRTMSNMDRTMSDNEPRMEDRDQAFSIEADIQNLMKSYNMLVEAQDFDRAQQVATMIDQLQQQKIGIQAQQANAQIQTGYAGSQRPQPIQDDISRILDSISI